MRDLLPRFLALLGEKAGEFEGVETGGLHHFDFLFYREMIVPNAHSYNGIAKVTIRVFRSVGAAGMPHLETFPLVVEISVDAINNDQPIARKGETYWEGSDFVETVREKDIFSEHGYSFSKELGDEALAQVIARLIRAGIVVPG